jgi:hypothetical protein
MVTFKVPRARFNRMRRAHGREQMSLFVTPDSRVPVAVEAMRTDRKGIAAKRLTPIWQSLEGSFSRESRRQIRDHEGSLSI